MRTEKKRETKLHEGRRSSGAVGRGAVTNLDDVFPRCLRILDVRSRNCKRLPILNIAFSLLLTA